MMWLVYVLYRDFSGRYLIISGNRGELDEYIRKLEASGEGKAIAYRKMASTFIEVELSEGGVRLLDKDGNEYQQWSKTNDTHDSSNEAE